MNQQLEDKISAHLHAGDYDGALTEAMKGYGPEIFGYLVSWLRDRALAEDAYSAFSEAVVKGIRGFRRTCSFRVWAYVVAEREAIRVREPRRRYTHLDTSQEGKLAAPVASSRPAHEQTAERERLERFRSTLSEVDQKIITLRVDRGLTWGEIALILSTPDAPIPPVRLRKKFQRAKEQLTELFRQTTTGLND